jgi:multidrug efflux pump subunit AcrB
MSYSSLGVNLLPNVAFPVVAVIASYPGASPAEMEKLVVKPIEDQLDGMENLDRLAATAQEGSAVIVARFKLDTDLNYETIDVQRRVDTARVYMPTDLSGDFREALSGGALGSRHATSRSGTQSSQRHSRRPVGRHGDARDPRLSGSDEAARDEYDVARRQQRVDV